MSKYIIEIDDNEVVNGCYKIVGTSNVLVSPNGLDTLEKYEESAEETVKEQPWPQDGDRYFCIRSDGDISECPWDNDDIDHKRMSIGDCFRTQEEAEFAVERLEVLAEMKKFAEPFDTKWDDYASHYYIYYNLAYKNLHIGYFNSMRCGDLCFESKEKANECIKAVGEDRIKKYYLGVK